MVIKESLLWLQRLKSARLETPMLCWVFGCGTGQEEVYGLWDSILPTVKMVMDEGNMLFNYPDRRALRSQSISWGRKKQVCLLINGCSVSFIKDLICHFLLCGVNEAVWIGPSGGSLG